MSYLHAYSSNITQTSTFVQTTENISEMLQPIEDIIRRKVIPAITGKSNINDILPEIADQLHATSRAIGQPLKDAVRNGDGNEDLIDADEARKFIKEKSRNKKKRNAAEIHDQLPSSIKKAVELAQEKGASTWLIVLPIEEHGFACTKVHFAMPWP